MDTVGQGLAPAEKEERIPFVPYDNTGNEASMKFKISRTKRERK